MTLVFDGVFSDGHSSATSNCRFNVYSCGRLEVVDATSGALLRAAEVREILVSPRLGQTPRYLDFACGARVETSDHAAVQTLTRQYQGRRWQDVLHKLESHLGLALASVLVTLGVVWASWQYGLPKAADWAAAALPVQVLDQAGRETMALLDKTYFSPSQLDPAWQTSLREQMQPIVERAASRALTIEFRHGGKLGANALALPNGTIVFTDEIVQLATHDRELLAVLAHEIGHIEARHSLRGLTQSMLMSVALTLWFGDASALGDLLVTVPLVLAQSAHSRDFEREADAFALALLQRENLDPRLFVTLMTRLSLSAHCAALTETDSDTETDRPAKDSAAKNSVAKSDSAPAVESEAAAPLIYASDPRGMSEADTKRCKALVRAQPTDEGLLGYFHSHPATDERLKQFLR